MIFRSGSVQSNPHGRLEETPSSSSSSSSSVGWLMDGGEVLDEVCFDVV